MPTHLGTPETQPGLPGSYSCHYLVLLLRHWTPGETCSKQNTDHAYRLWGWGEGDQETLGSATDLT